jgi:hypothetical protein
LRRILFSFWVFSVIGTFLNAPFTHTHAPDADHPESQVHSHFDLHIIEEAEQFNSQDGTAILMHHHHGALYLDLNAQTRNVNDLMAFRITRSSASQPVLRVVDVTLSSEARSHGPPTFPQIPARSPPTDLLSFPA